MIKGFRDFLMRGNVVDLAVAVVVGAAFTAVVNAFAADFVGGIIGIIGGTESFKDASFEINGSEIVYGSTITALVQFVIVAASVYVIIVVPMAKLQTLRAKDADAETPAPSDEAKLLTEIRDLLAAQQRS